jgi:IMP dehydrogenase
MKQAITFDDIQIKPSFSEILHRADCDVKTKITANVKLDIPIVSSPMDTITELQMAVALGKLGGLGIVHRFMSIERQATTIKQIKQQDLIAGAAIGITNSFIERAQELVKTGCDILLIDVAHGHHILVKEALRRLKNEIKGSFEIIVGSIATEEAARDLCEWGADCLRVGAGNGSLCTTRIRTGVGVPSVTALLDAISVSDIYSVPVIADGGIRNIGDVCKGLGCGADAVMLGSLLSGTKETPGEISKVGQWPNEQLYKKYRGSASLESKLERDENKNVEGESQLILYKGKIKRIIVDIIDGLKSSMSYVGAKDLIEFQTLAKFVKITPAGTIEAQPHLIIK